MKGSQIFTADRQLFIAQVKFLEKLLDPVFCAAGTKRKADSCGHLSCFTGSTQPWQAHAYHPGTSLFCSKPCHAHINANIARARTGTDAQTGRNFMKGFLKIKTCLSLLMVWILEFPRTNKTVDACQCTAAIVLTCTYDFLPKGLCQRQRKQMQRVHIITRSLKLAAIRRYVDHLIEDWKQTQGKLSLCLGQAVLVAGPKDLRV